MLQNNVAMHAVKAELLETKEQNAKRAESNWQGVGMIHLVCLTWGSRNNVGHPAYRSTAGHE